MWMTILRGVVDQERQLINPSVQDLDINSWTELSGYIVANHFTRPKKEFSIA